MQTITEALFSMQDEGYRSFHAGLIPGIDPERIIGVRMPALRRYAAALAQTSQAALFLRELPHTYYEENNLHALLLMREKDFSREQPQKKPEKKPSIREQLAKKPEQHTAAKPPAKRKDLER